jgi:hypothetical protein
VEIKRLSTDRSSLLLLQDSRPLTKDPTGDYSEGANHVLTVIHDILAHHRQLEAKWHAKKIKLHQRLALRLFQEDVKQVGKAIYFTQNEPFKQHLRSDTGFRLVAKSRRGVSSQEHWNREKPSEGQSLPEEPRNLRRRRTGKKADSEQLMLCVYST